MIVTENFEKVEVSNVKMLRSWLLKHYNQEATVWLVTYKKSVPEKYVSREEVLDELLCFGWIDGVRRKLDGDRTMQLIAPRRAQHWAQSYKTRAVKLIEEGRMHEAGEKAIRASKKSGLWHFMDSVDRLEVPSDLASALETKPKAKQFFDRINPSSKRFVLRWIKLAKTEKTRSKRIQKIVDLSVKEEKLPGS